MIRGFVIIWYIEKPTTSYWDIYVNVIRGPIGVPYPSCVCGVIGVTGHVANMTLKGHIIVSDI